MPWSIDTPLLTGDYCLSFEDSRGFDAWMSFIIPGLIFLVTCRKRFGGLDLRKIARRAFRVRKAACVLLILHFCTLETEW